MVYSNIHLLSLYKKEVWVKSFMCWQLICLLFNNILCFLLSFSLASFYTFSLSTPKFVNITKPTLWLMDYDTIWLRYIFSILPLIPSYLAHILSRWAKNVLGLCSIETVQTQCKELTKISSPRLSNDQLQMHSSSLLGIIESNIYV